jgi:hypothetical protein
MVSRETSGARSVLDVSRETLGRAGPEKHDSAKQPHASKNRLFFTMS